MPKKLLKIFLVIFLLTFSLNALVAAPAGAQLQTDTDWETQLDRSASGFDTSAAGGKTNLAVTVGNIIKTVLQFLGIILLILILYGGFLWMTSGGEEEKTAKAKKIITSAVIGVVIIVLAYAITYFVMNNLIKGATTGVGVLE